MMAGRGFCGNIGYFGHGFMNSGWHVMTSLIILAILIALIYFLVHNKKKMAVGQSALEILKMKYVQGEISEEEYLKRKDTLDK